METLYNMNEINRYTIITKSLEGEITVSEAAKRLRLSERQIKRLRKRVISEGIDGIRHGNKGHPSSGSVPEEMKQQIIGLKELDCYEETNFTHFRELLAEREEIYISYTPLYNILKASGHISKKKHRSKKTHRLRARRAYFGELVQADATPHDWFGTGDKATLHGFVDDATGKPVGLYFCEHECLFGYLEVTRQMLGTYGIPEELYPDQHSIFFPTSKQNSALTIEEQLAGKTSAKTQFGAIMDRLGIDMHPAPTAEAKGRIERFWNTVQDRLMVEMKLEGIKTIEEANAYLPKFIEKYNKRFAVMPNEKENKFIPVPDYIDLDYLLAMKFERKLDRAGTFSIKNKKFQVLNNKILPNANITIYMSNKIGIKVIYKEKRYDAVCIEDLPSSYKNLTFNKFCKEHSAHTLKFVSLLMNYDAKQHNPLLTSS